jgi:hypothetical protein
MIQRIAGEVGRIITFEQTLAVIESLLHCRFVELAECTTEDSAYSGTDIIGNGKLYVIRNVMV